LQARLHRRQHDIGPESLYCPLSSGSGIGNLSALFSFQMIELVLPAGC
jgi:hypothetical protein